MAHGPGELVYAEKIVKEFMGNGRHAFKVRMLIHLPALQSPIAEYQWRTH